MISFVTGVFIASPKILFNIVHFSYIPGCHYTVLIPLSNDLTQIQKNS